MSSPTTFPFAVIDGDAINEVEACAEAYGYVIDGIRKALAVPGRAPEDELSLRRCLQLAHSISGTQPIGPVA